MRNIYRLSCLALLSTSACSIHPIPFDVPNYNTLDIVRKIRCEAAKAIETNILIGLAGTEELKQYAQAVIVYHFTFTITESNTAEASAAFKLPLTHGTFSLGIGAGAEKERSGERDFTVTDTFAETLEELYKFEDTREGKKIRRKPIRRSGCEREADGPNWKYPITGRIGLDETVRTFVQLSHLHLLDAKSPEYLFPEVPPKPPAPAAPPLAQQEAPPSSLQLFQDSLAVSKAAKAKKPKPPGPVKKDAGGGKDGKAEEFSDELEFTTTIKANANPSIELKPVGSAFKLTGADATISGQRIDKHKVIITMTLAKKDENQQETKQRASEASEVKIQRSLTSGLTRALTEAVKRR